MRAAARRRNPVASQAKGLNFKQFLQKVDFL